jgi:hypothetical protein
VKQSKAAKNGSPKVPKETGRKKVAPKPAKAKKRK